MEIMTNTEFQASVRADPDNRTGGRNQRNTPISAYNCGGFALGIFDWITPYIRTTDFDDYPAGSYTDSEREYFMNEFNEANWSAEDIEEEILQRDVDFLLHRYPFLEEVNLEDCDIHETVIAYRLFIAWDDEQCMVEDTDFHFKVRINGFWFEKMGSEKITKCDLQPDEPWDYPAEAARYTSSIVYFTIKEDFR